MTTWKFALVCRGPAEWTDELVERVAKALDDAAFASVNGVPFVEVAVRPRRRTRPSRARSLTSRAAVGQRCLSRTSSRTSS